MFRKAAMWTARSNFSHIIVTEQEGNHQLVTSGVYSFCRHPSYLGWFCWSVGTQLLLCNPFCFVAYTAASISFFRDRVPFEEKMLINIFHEQYVGTLHVFFLPTSLVHSTPTSSAPNPPPSQTINQKYQFGFRLFTDTPSLSMNGKHGRGLRSNFFAPHISEEEVGRGVIGTP